MNTLFNDIFQRLIIDRSVSNAANRNDIAPGGPIAIDT
jgi:hypothetical protein